MAIQVENYHQILNEVNDKQATLVAVSKLKPTTDIQALYDLGHRDFGENYVQELTTKQQTLPNDIHWHFIGHLQSNKVKYIAPFVHLIQGVDSIKLLAEINKQAARCNRIINCLLQVHIAMEETKFGFDVQEIEQLDWGYIDNLKNVQVIGLMGMASFSDNQALIKQEFATLSSLYYSTQQKRPQFTTLSMGMSSDYGIALEQGSNLIRVGSKLFGNRN